MSIAKRRLGAVFQPARLASALIYAKRSVMRFSRRVNCGAPLNKQRSWIILTHHWAGGDERAIRCSAQIKLKRFHSDLAGRLAFCPSTPKSAGKSAIVSNRIFNTGTLLLALCNGNINHVMTNNKDFLQLANAAFQFSADQSEFAPRRRVEIWIYKRPRGQRRRLGVTSTFLGRTMAKFIDAGQWRAIKLLACTTLRSGLVLLSVNLFGRKQAWSNKSQKVFQKE